MNKRSVPLDEVDPQWTETKKFRNFALPTQLGLSAFTERFSEPRCLNTDLKSIEVWNNFDQWVGFKLSLINKSTRDFALRDFTNSEYGYTCRVDNEEDLHQVLKNFVFKLTKKMLHEIDGQYSKYDFVERPHDSYDFMFRKNGDHGLFIIEAESANNWPELGSDHGDGCISRRYLERLYSYMVSNQVEYAVATTYQQTRFVRLRDRTLYVSDSYAFNEQAKHTVLGALVAMVLHTSNYKVSTPASSIAEHSLELQVTSSCRYYKSGTVTLKDSRFIRNERMYGGEGEFRSLECIAKFQDISKDQQDRLEWEAEVYRRLELLQGEIVPEVLTFGQVWSACSVLVLSKEGRPLKYADFKRIPNIRQKVLSLLHILHSNNIVHGDIRPSNFLVDASGDLFIANLGQCRVTYNGQLKNDELQTARTMLSRGLPRDIVAGLVSWRQFKSRKSVQGWKRYQNDYCRVRRGAFVRLQKLDDESFFI